MIKLSDRDIRKITEHVNSRDKFYVQKKHHQAFLFSLFFFVLSMTSFIFSLALESILLGFLSFACLWGSLALVSLFTERLGKDLLAEQQEKIALRATDLFNFKEIITPALQDIKKNKLQASWYDEIFKIIDEAKKRPTRRKDSVPLV